LLDQYGRVDVLFNNAVARSGGELMDTSVDEWESVMALNSTGLFLSCRLFGEAMMERKSGSIVNVASIYGMVGPDFSLYEGTPIHNSVSYAYAKGGMINLTRYLASFLAPHGVRVNTLSPGGVSAGQPDRFVENYNKRVPMGRLANGADLQGAAVFLASDASAYITGQNIAVDGGWTAI
jgi:NAD(P)-dependent dehydrogenase (short-subunit alcohol dehydrogenase family)